VTVGPEGHWFEHLADHMGPAYLRYSFTKGTEQEVGFLVDVLGLTEGMRVLDVGCGPGRHAHALARRGIEVHGVDISERFVDIARLEAPPGSPFQRLDARRLPFEAEFDAVISLCQGAFGLSDGGPGPLGAPDPDRSVLDGMARALVPDGLLAVSAFSSYFQVRWLDPEVATFDADRGVNHERTVVKDEAGRDEPVDLWTTCFTPRELRLMVAASGLELEGLWSVRPGEYAANRPDIDHEEFLVLARRPGI